MKTSPAITRVILYVRNMQAVSAFYQTHFGFQQEELAYTDLLHLTSPSGGCAITLLQASKGHKLGGQSQVKLVFDVDDIEAFKQTSAKRGLRFGAIHRGDTYEFSNARDPAKNLIQISSRRFYSAKKTKLGR
jgi:predicted enzyme related to lactoylglutathione lyase